MRTATGLGLGAASTSTCPTSRTVPPQSMRVLHGVRPHHRRRAASFAYGSDTRAQLEEAERVVEAPKRIRSPGAMQAAVEGPLRRLMAPAVVYSNDRSLLTPTHVRALWAETMPAREVTTEKLQLVIDKSFTVTLALMYEPRPRGDGLMGFSHDATDTPRAYKLVGLARSMSDAAFVATVCDVAVSPAVQGRGIGKRLVRNLVADMRSLGPSSFAVFPRPEHREFFFKCGFRLSHRFIMMKYMRGQGGDALAGDGQNTGDELEAVTMAPPAEVKLRSSIGVVLATNGRAALLDDIPLNLFETGSNSLPEDGEGAPSTHRRYL